MTGLVAVHHRTRYCYDRAVWLSPHEIRLRPAPHARSRVQRYELAVPAAHRIWWFHDAYGNATARALFSEPTTELAIDVTLTVDLQPANPFDFLVASHAEAFPFAYAPDECVALAPCLHVEPGGARMAASQEALRTRLDGRATGTVEALLILNRFVAETIRYVRRMEPGVHSPEQTLEQGFGSCRDSTWLLVQLLRRCGVAARFVSGYLIQPPPAEDGAAPGLGVDLHAWCETYVPGAGWIGLDPTSGLITAEMHIPLACAAVPGATAAVQGYAGTAESRLSVDMTAGTVPQAAAAVLPATAGGQQ